MKNQENKWELQQIQDQLPPIAPGLDFSVQKVDNVTFPHPYCITPKHVGIAADHFGGILGEEAIKYAEKQGACCDICRQQKEGILPFDQHVTQIVVFVEVPHHDLNNISGLREWLVSVKNATNLPVDAFAFPKKKR